MQGEPLVHRKGGKMTNNRRISVSLTPDLEKRVMEMRKTDEFCRISVAEIIRILIARGLEEENEQVRER